MPTDIKRTKACHILTPADGSRTVIFERELSRKYEDGYCRELPEGGRIVRRTLAPDADPFVPGAPIPIRYSQLWATLEAAAEDFAQEAEAADARAAADAAAQQAHDAAISARRTKEREDAAKPKTPGAPNKP